MEVSGAGADGEGGRTQGKSDEKKHRERRDAAENRGVEKGRGLEKGRGGRRDVLVQREGEEGGTKGSTKRWGVGLRLEAVGRTSGMERSIPGGGSGQRYVCGTSKVALWLVPVLVLSLRFQPRTLDRGVRPGAAPNACLSGPSTSRTQGQL